MHSYFTARNGGNSVVVTLPSKFCKQLGIERGDLLDLSLREGAIIIEKVKVLQRKNSSSQRDNLRRKHLWQTT